MTQNLKLTGLPPMPTLPPLAEIYVLLMQDIEPDLIRPQEELDALYADETPEEHAAREERYAAADATFKQAYKDYIELYKHAVGRYKRAVNKEFEFLDSLADTELEYV